MNRQQAIVVEWVVTRPIFDVCAREMGYKGGRRLRVTRWRKKAAEDQLRVTLEAISEAERVRQQQESSRRDRSKGGSTGGDHIQ